MTPDRLGTVIDPASLIGVDPAQAAAGWCGHRRDREVVTSVVSIDRFGNVELALLPEVLDEVGSRPRIGRGRGTRSTGGRPSPARWVAAFAELDAGELGLLVDSSGRLALVCNRASAATRLGLGRDRGRGQHPGRRHAVGVTIGGR